MSRKKPRAPKKRLPPKSPKERMHKSLKKHGPKTPKQLTK